ncbi:hypothetical protein VTO73DRAFT_7940 [Trametes versicolor]
MKCQAARNGTMIIPQQRTVAHTCISHHPGIQAIQHLVSSFKHILHGETSRVLTIRRLYDEQKEQGRGMEGGPSPPRRAHVHTNPASEADAPSGDGECARLCSSIGNGGNHVPWMVAMVLGVRSFGCHAHTPADSSSMHTPVPNGGSASRA